MRGYFAVGIYHPKNSINIGTLWRTALLFDAAYVFTIGRRYRHQASDTFKTPRHIPMFNYASMDEFLASQPHDCRLVGVELDARAQELEQYQHPERAIYLLGAEDYGLPDHVLERCQDVIRLPGDRSMNVATAGSITIYDRHQKYAYKHQSKGKQYA